MDALVEQIAKNVQVISARIRAAALSAGRAPEKVRLVVVTKAQPVEVVEAALRAGVSLCGENYPDESQAKIIQLKAHYPCEWHMIGHLQSRKAAIVAEHFDFYQSLDRLEIAQKLNQLLADRNRRLPVLLEFNTGGEESKSGWDAAQESNWGDLLQTVQQIARLPQLEIRGLMTMPPLSEDPELARPFFVRLRRLRDFFQDQIPALNFSELSMGTSSDFEIGVQEGATMVRIGTAILGPRPPRKP
jgi:pyridoxal phosphate enzyme (YggS family)